MKTSLLVMLLLAIAALSAFATAQFPDKILYDGKEYSLHTNPMDSYFSKHPNKKPKDEVMCTALWRGYVATFEIKDNDLALTDIEVMVMKKNKDGESNTAFKSVKDAVISQGKTLVIDWFTGILVLPHGELVNYVHMGYGSTYSNYILLEIKKGKLTGKHTFDHKEYEQFKEKQFQAFKKMEIYRKHAGELKKREWSQEDIDSFLRRSVVNYTSEFLDEEGASDKAIDSDNK